MADPTPVDLTRTSPFLRPPVPIWPRRWVGFPSVLPPLIGREGEIAALRALFEERHRLITLTGPGGVGKTRLAIEMAEEVEGAFADGAAFVPLAAVSDPSLVLSTIARTLRIRESPKRSLAESLSATLRHRQLLLVLDNFEHLVAAAHDLGGLLESCPGLTALVTSRAPLRLRGEQRFAIPPLALPERVDATDVAALAQYGAVALFVECAQQARHEFALTTQNVASVVQICRRLDGLPLAIELAAAWVRVLPPSALLERLELRLPLLRGGAEDLPARHRTMRDAIAWTYELLPEGEQQFFRRLAVFVDGFSLEAAAQVAGNSPLVLETASEGELSRNPQLPSESSTIDLLAALIDKSLVQPINPEAPDPRYTMLETVREFSLEQLAINDEIATISSAHAAYFLGLAESAGSAVGGAGRGSWMIRLATERPNLLAALDWLEQTGQTGDALRMTGALWPYWYRLGDLRQGRTRLERALANAPAEVEPLLRARALRGAGVLAWQSADYEPSRAWLDAALLAYQAIDDQPGIAWVLNSLGCLFASLSAWERAEGYLTEALANFRELGDVGGTAQVTANLGELAGVEGRYDLAIERLDAALAMWRDLGDRVGAARAQVFLAQALLARGDLATADAILLEALTSIRDLDYEQILPAALRTAADIAARRGAHANAARWYGAEDRLRETLGMELPGARRASYKHAIAAVREALGEAAFSSAWSVGHSLSAGVVVTEVLSASTPPPTSALPAAVHDLHLSTREREVLSLLCDGRTDREIASMLFISPRTASSHVAAILAKLAVRSRGEAALRAVRDGLV